MGRPRRQMAEGSVELRAKIKDLAMRGMSIRQIAAVVPTSYDKAKYHVCALYWMGQIPDAATRRKFGDKNPKTRVLAMARYQHGVRAGSMNDILSALSPETLDWLLRQTPKGGTVADIVRSMIVDVFNEEVGDAS
jgi:hypothetical protein